MKNIWTATAPLRRSDLEYYGFTFSAKELKTPTLEHYFKSVHINLFAHGTLMRARHRLGLPIYN